MPAFESSEPSISFCDYFDNPLPKDVVEDFPRRTTHLANNIAPYISEKTSIQSSKRVLSQKDIDTAAASLKPFQSVKEPILQVQAFASEQDVWYDLDLITDTFLMPYKVMPIILMFLQK